MKNLIKKLLGADGIDDSRSFGMTDPGLRRENNEDAFAVLSDRNIYIVADGMGGHNAGEVASAESIRILETYFTRELVDSLSTDKNTASEHMNRAFLEASRSIYEMAKTDPSMKGMGCTLIMAFLSGNQLHTCHIGDVRCYVCGSSGIEQVGNDHSQVWDLVRAGQLTPEQARKHSHKNILTQAVGQRAALAPEYHCREVQPKERVLLCSDGLWDMLSDEEIHSIVMRHRRPKAACRELVEQANRAGGKDNITVVVFGAGESGENDFDE